MKLKFQKIFGNVWIPVEIINSEGGEASEHGEREALEAMDLEQYDSDNGGANKARKETFCGTKVNLMLIFNVIM